MLGTNPQLVPLTATELISRLPSDPSLRTLRPRITRELGADVAEAIFIRNPSRAFDTP